MPKPKIDFGAIKLKTPKYKIRKISFKDKDIVVTKLDNKVHYYTKKYRTKDVSFKNIILQLSPFAKKMIKKFPEIKIFLEENLIKSIKNRKINFENELIKIELEPYYVRRGYSHSAIKKLKIHYKKENISELYFVKIGLIDKLVSSTNEFIANKILEKYGINTIKPHMAYFDHKTRNIIIYDFTNLHTLNSALEKGIIKEKEYQLITKKIKSINKYLRKKLKNSDIGIGDLNNINNIFIKKTNNEIKVYFTDLLIY